MESMIARARKNSTIMEEWYKLFELQFMMAGPFEVAAIVNSISPFNIKHFVDVGCGAGDFTYALNQHYGLRIDALEPERYFYDKTVKKFPPSRIKFLNIPLSSYGSTTDCLFFRFVVQHFPDKTGLCLEASRLLPSGGIAIIIESIACRTEPLINAYKNISLKFCEFYGRGAATELESDTTKSFVAAGFQLKQRKILHIPISSPISKSIFGKMLYNAGLVKAMCSEQDLSIMKELRGELQSLEAPTTLVNCQDIMLIFQKL